jgi:hypothetical protein
VNRQRRNAVITIAITIALLALFVGLAPGGQSTPTSSAKAFTWLRPTPTPASGKVVRDSRVGLSRTQAVRLVSLPAQRSSRVHP